ncbi:MAG: guanylate kinase [Candidatus Dormibacteraceae bacterium]
MEGEVERSLLVVISGPGGVGKDTVIEQLLESSSRYCYSVSYTTRPQREYEVDGEHYSFVDVVTFQQMAQQGALLEFATVNGHLYGTSEARVEAAQRGGSDVILKIDVQGADQVRQRRPDGVFIFIAPPSMEELIRRREERGSESPEEISRRQELAEWEMAFAKSYDHIVVNDELERAVAEIAWLLEQERQIRCEPNHV